MVIPNAPARELSPNWSGFWAKRARAVKQMREAAWAAGCNARPRKPYRGRVLLEATIYWNKGRKKMDRSNAAASLKALIDGLTDAGWWKDDKDVDVLVVKQVSWSAQGKRQQRAYPGGCVIVEVVK